MYDYQKLYDTADTQVQQELKNLAELVSDLQDANAKYGWDDNLFRGMVKEVLPNICKALRNSVKQGVHARKMQELQ